MRTIDNNNGKQKSTHCLREISWKPGGHVVACKRRWLESLIEKTRIEGSMDPTTNIGCPSCSVSTSSSAGSGCHSSSMGRRARDSADINCLGPRKRHLPAKNFPSTFPTCWVTAKTLQNNLPALYLLLSRQLMDLDLLRFLSLINPVRGKSLH